MCCAPSSTNGSTDACFDVCGHCRREPLFSGAIYADLDHAESLWNRAAADGAHGDPFCCRTEWQLSFHETFAPRRPLHLRQDAHSVAAFAQCERVGVGPMLEPVESSWLFGCPLLGDGAVELLRELLGDLSGGDQLSLLISGVLPAGDLARQLLAQFGERYEFWLS